MGVTMAPYMPPVYKNDTYQIVVVMEPTDGKYKCYGIENRATTVIEAYISNLAKAIRVADDFEHDLKHGIPSRQKENELSVALLNAMSKKPPREGGGGSLN